MRRCILAAVALSLAACARGKSTLSHKPSAEAAEDAEESEFDRLNAGAVNAPTVYRGAAAEAQVSATSEVPQRVRASANSPIGSTEVLFPVGSFASDTVIILQPGQTVATLAHFNGLSIETEIISSSHAIDLKTSVAEDALLPFTISLALPPVPAALAPADPYANLTVVYNVEEFATSRRLVGVMPRSRLIVTPTHVRFQTRFFGHYQAVLITTPIAQPVEVARPAPKLRSFYYAQGFVGTSFDEQLQTKDGLQTWTPGSMIRQDTEE